MSEVRTSTSKEPRLRAVGERHKRRKPAGLEVRRRFTRAGGDPFDCVEWELRTARLTNERGEVIFE